jgi:glycosyltransferase involved in cell wall biosynthesis
MSQNVLVINQYYVPDVASSGQLLADLCEGLVLRGHRISVVCAQPSYEMDSSDVSPREKLGDVDVYRTPMGIFRGRSNFIVRVIGYFIFLMQAWFKASSLLRREKFDVVITLSNPPFVGILGALISKIHGIKYMAVVYDIHPDVVQATRWIKLPNFVFFLWNQVAKWILAHSAKVVVLGEGMKETLVNTKDVKPENIRVIPVWAKPEFSETLQQRQDENELDIRKLFNIDQKEFIVLFAGNIGIMQPVDEVLGAAQKCAEDPVKFIFLGGGVGFEDLKDRIRNLKLANVLLLKYQPQELFEGILKESDVCVVTLAKGMEKYSVPSRAFTFMSAGKPIIAAMVDNSDIGSIIRKSDCGWVSNSSLGIADVILGCINCNDIVLSKGKNAHDYYYSELSKKEGIDRFSKLIMEME